MKVMFIRHGEPDYSRDCLTENGIRQAKLLAERLKNENISAAFTSPMGRAAQTAAICMDGRMPVTECTWLHEFDVRIGGELTWDILPSEFDERRILTDCGFAERFKNVRDGVDEILKSCGLERVGAYYKRLPNADTDRTFVFFCHFGATCAAAAHLIGASPAAMLRGLSAEPTAIATFCTDDRFGDEVNFRMHGFGDIAHLASLNAEFSGVNYR